MDSLHRKHAEKGRGEMRLNEYQVDDESWIKALLRNGLHAVLATSYQDQPFATPILYVFVEDDHAIYFHGARTGRLRANLHYNPEVACNISIPGRLLAHQEASEFNLEYQSATIFGTASVLIDQVDAKRVLTLLMEKYAQHLEPGKDYQPVQEEEVIKTAVYKIAIETWTGKQQSHDSEYFEVYDFIPPGKA